MLISREFNADFLHFICAKDNKDSTYPFVCTFFSLHIIHEQTWISWYFELFWRSKQKNKQLKHDILLWFLPLLKWFSLYEKKSSVRIAIFFSTNNMASLVHCIGLNTLRVTSFGYRCFCSTRADVVFFSINFQINGA